MRDLVPVIDNNYYVIVICMYMVIKGREDESQLQLQEETIYHLKQEMASLREEKDATIFTLQEKIKEQMSEIEELRAVRGQLSLHVAQIKREDGIIYTSF